MRRAAMSSNASVQSGQAAERSCALAALLPESLLNGLIDLLDARGLAALRRAGHLGSVAREAEIAEVRAIVLELLDGTKFPFTHNCYVLGLNGPYYSLDTVADHHYGIPRLLPALLCRYFSLETPGVPFTTLRIQKFAAAANFGGRHRTLAFSLGSPENLLDESGIEVALPQAPAPAPEEHPAPLSHARSLHLAPALEGHVICISSGCTGGRAELAEDEDGLGPWRWLTGPRVRPSWTTFPSLGWLRWHWPSVGCLYAITVNCESSQSRSNLRRRERKQLVTVGFVMPTDADNDGQVSESEEEEVPEPVAAPTPAERPRTRRVQEAKRILNLLGTIAPDNNEVEAAFRDAVRRAHPDRAAVRGSGADVVAVVIGNHDGVGVDGGVAEGADLDEPMGSWRVSQIVWARRVLQQALSAGAVGVDEEAAGAVLADGVDEEADGAVWAGGAAQEMLQLLQPEDLPEGDAGGDAAGEGGGDA